MKQKNLFEKIIFPDYDEATFLNISITILCLVFLNNELRQGIINTFIKFNKKEIADLLFCIPYLLIIIDSIYHAFTKKQKSKFEMLMMLFLTMYVNLFNTATIISLLIESDKPVLIIFPIINGIHIILFFSILKYGGEEGKDWLLDMLVSEKDIELHESITGIIINLIIFCVCEYVLSYNWAITLTICVTYTVTVRKSIDSVFFEIYRIIKGKFKYPDIIE